MDKQEQKNLLFQNYFNRYFPLDSKGRKNIQQLELIISSYCNQACDYCYLRRFGKEMYPVESNDEKNILRNLPLLLDYLYYDQNCYWTLYNFFSGEFFDLPYWEDIFQIIYDFEKKINDPVGRDIVIPTNMSWLLNDEVYQKVEKWFNKLQKIQVYLRLSASVDGPLDLEFDVRPFIDKKNNTIKEQIFYDKMFNFLKKYKSGAHPMISKNFLENYEENYKFWYENLVKYKCYVYNQNGDKILILPMFLEVRDENQWTLESLKNYHNFLNFAAEYDLQNLSEGNLEDFAYRFFDNYTRHSGCKGKYCQTQPYFLAFPDFYEKIPCSIQSGMKIRVGDLSLVPCHRTCYSSFIYGYFSLNEEKNKIIGLTGKNINLAFKIKTFNANRSNLKCSNCEIKAFCSKGCLGSQLESTGELFNAIDSVCDMYYVKYITLHRIAKKYNLYEIILNSPYVEKEGKEFIKYVKNILSRLDNPERLQNFSFM